MHTTSDIPMIGKLKDEKYRNAFMAAWVKSTLALQIRGLRKNVLKKSQEEFASLLGTGKSAVSRMENPEYGKMSMELLLKLAKTFNVALVIEFIGFDEFLERKRTFSEKTLMIPPFNEFVTVTDNNKRIPSAPPITADPTLTPQIGSVLTGPGGESTPMKGYDYDRETA